MYPPSRKLIDSNTSSFARAYASVIFDIKRKQNIEDVSYLDLIVDSLEKYINVLNEYENNYYRNISNINSIFPLAFTNVFEVACGENRESIEDFKEIRGEVCYLESRLKKLYKDSAAFYDNDHKDVLEFLEKTESSFYN